MSLENFEKRTGKILMVQKCERRGITIGFKYCRNAIDQTEALENQFEGMSDTPFTYADYEKARRNLIQQVNDSLTETDREFLLSFENGEPDWEKCCAGDLSRYPSAKWKLQNIAKLKKSNPQKHKAGLEKLQAFLFPEE